MADFDGSVLPASTGSGTEAPSGGMLGCVPDVLELVFTDPIPPDLPSPGRALRFTVLGIGDAGATIVALYSTGAHEVVHDGEAFTQTYAAGSTVTPAAGGGSEYLVRRAGGWFGDSVTIQTITGAAGG